MKRSKTAASSIALAAFVLLGAGCQSQNQGWTAEAAAVLQEEAPAHLTALRFTGRENTQLCLLNRDDGKKATIYLDMAPAVSTPFIFSSERQSPTDWAVSNSLDMSSAKDISVDDFHALVHACIEQSGEAFESQSDARRLENEASWAHAAEDRAAGHPHKLAAALTEHNLEVDLPAALSKTMQVLTAHMLDVNRKMAGISDKDEDPDLSFNDDANDDTSSDKDAPRPEKRDSR